jgi:hypothetical protein
MWRTLSITLVLLALGEPLLAKDEASSGKLSKNFALEVDLVTGRCQVEEVGVDPEVRPGFKLLGYYSERKKAEAAGLRATECRGKIIEKREGATLAAKKCKKDVEKSRSNLFGLISRLRSGTSDDVLFANCMRSSGYGADN